MHVIIQIASDHPDIPEPGQLMAWAEAAGSASPETEVVIRIVDTTESATLNQTYRHK